MPRQRMSCRIGFRRRRNTSVELWSRRQKVFLERACKCRRGPLDSAAEPRLRPMCGIAGIVGMSPQGAAPLRVELEQMITRLRHRGPDGFGFYEDGRAGLAHARLSIIDVAGRRPADSQRGPIGLGGFQRGDRQLRRAARGARAPWPRLLHAFGYRSHRPPLRAAWRSTSSTISTGSSQSPCGIVAAGAWSWRATGQGSGLCSTPMHGGRLVFASEIKALFGARGVPRRLLRMRTRAGVHLLERAGADYNFRRRALPAFRAHPGAGRRQHARPQILGLGVSATRPCGATH